MPSQYYDTSNPGAAVSVREDFLDKVSTLGPSNTPYISLCQKRVSGQVKTDWFVDELDDPDITGSLPGTDTSTHADAFANLANLSTYNQRFFRTYGVDDFMEASNSVGPVDIARAEIKKGKEILRDMETRFLSREDHQAGGAGQKPLTRGLGDWLDSAGPSDVPSDYRTPAASFHSGDTMSETQFNTVLASIFSQTGMETTLTCIAGTGRRRTISNFTRAEGTTTQTPYTVNQNASEKKVTLSVRQYDSDWGIVNIINGNPACMPDPDCGYVIDPSKVMISRLYNTKTKRQDDDGGGERGYIRAAAANCCLDPRCHGELVES